MKKWAFLAGVCLTGIYAMGASAQDVGSDEESRRFTAERVFDIEYATSPQISPDGSKIVSGCNGGTIKVWDAGGLWASNRLSLYF